jgi:hypothetical protein
MLCVRYYLLVVCLLSCPAAAGAGGQDIAHALAVDSADITVRRNYLNTSHTLISGYALVLEGSPKQIMRLSRWLDEIIVIPSGRQTLNAILESGNQLTIRHSEWALQSSGRTLAPLSDNLTNGRGADVEILFDMRIPERGSHLVFDAHQNSIEFTAVQNLFHELVHAKHLVNGTWRYFDSEGQAIEEENIFRRQHSEQRGLSKVSLRATVDGHQIWWPGSAP